MKSKLLIIFFLFFLIGANKEAVKIEANNLKYFGEKKYSLFEGNVIAVYEKNKIFSDKMYVYMNDDNKIDRIICEGNVKLMNDNITATSKRAEYDVNNDILYLLNGVKVWQDENYLEGEQITVYTKTNRIEVVKGKNKRVIVIFKPEENENGEKNVP
jgi:lipopolysaccharide transport protein LptA